jgi:hypothetical protein
MENIVVIALLTVLVAVMVFVFAGYTEKAKDERYVFEAREHLIAARAVLSESSVTGDLASVAPTVAPSAAFPVAAGDENPALKAWSLAQLSEYTLGNEDLLRQRAMRLIDGTAPSASDTASWELWLVGSASAASLWDADGFLYVAWPEDQEARGGQGSQEAQANQVPVGNETVVYVTYRMDRVDLGVGTGEGADFLSEFWQKATYNPQAGFETYRLS